MTNFSDTICAPATSVGTGAVSMIRISGPESLAAVDKVVCFRSGNACSSRGYVLKYGEIPGVDEVVAGIYRAPHSYTGEDSVELCCHASSYVVGRILELLCDNGCRLAEAGEFTRRAFVNGKMDLAQAEAVADMIASSSEAQHRVALNQLRGGYSAELGKIRAELLKLTTLMELELDFSEEDVEFADRGTLAEILDDAIAHCTALADSFRLGNAIRNGVPVAIVGAPNSGKSTLLNALLHDERAIVSEVPGTTRDTVEETCVIGGVLFRFIDTAGIRETDDKVERLGIERSFNKAAQAEVVLGVVDASAHGVSESSKEVRLNMPASPGHAEDRPLEVPPAFPPGADDRAEAGSATYGFCTDTHEPGSRLSSGAASTEVSPIQRPLPRPDSRPDAARPAPLDAEGDSSVAGQIRRLAGMVDLKRQKLVILMNKCDILSGNGDTASAGIVRAESAGSASDVHEDTSRGISRSIGAPCPSSDTSAAASASDDSRTRRTSSFPGSNGVHDNRIGGNNRDNKNVTHINNFVKTLVPEWNEPRILWISAKCGLGLEELRELLASLVGKAAADGVLVTNARHAAALRNASAALRTVRSGLDSLPTDLLAEDLRDALASLGSITGEITTDEVLGEIFRGFCIGK